MAGRHQRVTGRCRDLSPPLPGTIGDDELGGRQPWRDQRRRDLHHDGGPDAAPPRGPPRDAADVAGIGLRPRPCAGRTGATTIARPTSTRSSILPSSPARSASGSSSSTAQRTSSPMRASIRTGTERKAAQDLEKMVRETRRFWGFLPFKRYVFLNVFRQGGGGLEHANSTLLTSSPKATKPTTGLALVCRARVPSRLQRQAAASGRARPVRLRESSDHHEPVVVGGRDHVFRPTWCSPAPA